MHESAMAALQQAARALRARIHRDSRWHDSTTSHGRLVASGYLDQLSELLIANGASARHARGGAFYVAFQIAHYADGQGSPDGSVADTRDDILTLAKSLRSVIRAFDALGDAAAYRLRVLVDFPTQRHDDDENVGDAHRRFGAATGESFDTFRSDVADLVETLEACAAFDVVTAKRYLNVDALYLAAIDTWFDLAVGDIPKVGGRDVLFDVLERATCFLIGLDHSLCERLSEPRFDKLKRQRQAQRAASVETCAEIKRD